MPIISQTRYLEKRGEVQEINRGGTFLNLRPKFSLVYLFLFNDLLVIASKKRLESWKTCLCYGFTKQELSITKSNTPVCTYCGCLVNPVVSESDLFISTSLSLCCSSERYVVLDHAHRSLVQVQPFREDTAVPSLEHCFCLTLLENHQGRQMERVMKAPTQYVEL